MTTAAEDFIETFVYPPVKVTLKRSVSHGDKTYKDLFFREPEVGDLILSETATPGLGQMVTLLATISDVPLPAFKKIKSDDFKAIVLATKALLGNDQTNTTGD